MRNQKLVNKLPFSWCSQQQRLPFPSNIPLHFYHTKPYDFLLHKKDYQDAYHKMHISDSLRQMVRKNILFIYTLIPLLADNKVLLHCCVADKMHFSVRESSYLLNMYFRQNEFTNQLLGTQLKNLRAIIAGNHHLIQWHRMSHSHRVNLAWFQTQLALCHCICWLDHGENQ